MTISTWPGCIFVYCSFCLHNNQWHFCLCFVFCCGDHVLECLYNGNVIYRHFYITLLISLFSFHSMNTKADDSKKNKMKMSSQSTSTVFFCCCFLLSKVTLISNGTRPSSCFTAHITITIVPRLGSDSLDTIFMIYIFLQSCYQSYHAVPLFLCKILLESFFVLRYDRSHFYVDQVSCERRDEFCKTTPYSRR